MAEFVPPDFKVPLRLETSDFVLEPLGPEHNEQDYDAFARTADDARSLRVSHPYRTLEA